MDYFGSGSSLKVAIDTCKMPQSEKRPCSFVRGREGEREPFESGSGMDNEMGLFSLPNLSHFLLMFYFGTSVLWSKFCCQLLGRKI